MSSKNLTTLNRLHRLCLAGERGFNTVASTIDASGIKILLKTFAQQRRELADALRQEIKRLGGSVNERESFGGLVHRGRITIFSAMTVGPDNRERAAFKEALRGEKIVQRAYRKALQLDFSTQTQALLQNQLNQIKVTTNFVQHLHGEPGRRLVVKQFDSNTAAEQARQRLVSANFPISNIEIVGIREKLTAYVGHGSTVSEAIISGAIGGFIWGLVMGILAGGFVLLIPDMSPILTNSLQSMTVLAMVMGALLGMLFGGVFGAVIGSSVKQQDDYQYERDITDESALLYLKTDRRNAFNAGSIMRGMSTAIIPTPQPIRVIP